MFKYILMVFYFYFYQNFYRNSLLDFLLKFTMFRYCEKATFLKSNWRQNKVGDFSKFVLVFSENLNFIGILLNWFWHTYTHHLLTYQARILETNNTQLTSCRIVQESSIITDLNSNRTCRWRNAPIDST